MFNLSYSVSHKGEIKTIRFPSRDGKENNPLWRGLGHYRDINGVVWDIYGVSGGGGRPWVQARVVDGHPLYSTATARVSTSSSTQGTIQLQDGWYDDSMWSATWRAYYIEIVEAASE